MKEIFGTFLLCSVLFLSYKIGSEEKPIPQTSAVPPDSGSYQKDSIPDEHHRIDTASVITETIHRELNSVGKAFEHILNTYVVPAELLVIIIVLVTVTLLTLHRLKKTQLPLKESKDLICGYAEEIRTSQKKVVESTQEISKQVTMAAERTERINEALEKFGVNLERLPNELAKTFDEILADREKERSRTERDAFLRQVENRRKNIEERTKPMLQVSVLTQEIIDAVEAEGKNESRAVELKGKYNYYLEVAQLVAQIKEECDSLKNMEPDPSWEIGKQSLLEQLQMLSEKASKLSSTHNPNFFCQLLDEARSIANDKRGKLLEAIGVEEYYAEVGKAVENVANYEVIGSLPEATQYQVYESVGPGYRRKDNGTVLRRPRVKLGPRR